jgi:cyclase
MIGGADELVFLDISASAEGRETRWKLFGELPKMFNPFTMGGLASTIADIRRWLRAVRIKFP